MNLRINTDEYRHAMARNGPLEAQWADKPHRLVYDLCNEIERLYAQLNAKPDQIRDELEEAEAHLAVIRMWKSDCYKAISKELSSLRQNAQTQMHAQADILGFHFDRHDPRSIQEIVAQSVPLSKQRDILLVHYDRIQHLNDEDRKVFDSLQM